MNHTDLLINTTTPLSSWSVVATWKWNTADDTCGICRNMFDGCCPDCKVPGDECPIVWGKCKHVFHMHCILKWLGAKDQQTCPMDRQPWEFTD